MNLKTAKARGDYRFTLNGVEHPQVLTDLRKGSMDSLSGAAEPYIGAAVREIGHDASDRQDANQGAAKQACPDFLAGCLFHM